MNVKKIEETSKDITVRVNDKTFSDDSFRTIQVDRKKGISQRIGELKSSGKTETHSFIFLKDNGWTPDSAKEWVESKDYTVKNVSSYVMDCAIKHMDDNGLDMGDIAFFTESNEFQVKEMTDDNGMELFWIKGYLSTYDLDRGSDFVVKGGYDKTNEEHKKLKKFPLLRDHSACTDDQMGAWVKFKIDDKGYYVEGYIVVDEKSRHIVNLIKAGALNTLSAGGIWVYDKVIQKENNGENVTMYPIKDMLIFEGSIVTIPMNPEAQFTAKAFKNPQKVSENEKSVEDIITQLANDPETSALIKKYTKGNDSK